MIEIKTLSTAEQKETHFKCILIYSATGKDFTDHLGEKMYYDDETRAQNFCNTINNLIGA